MKAKIIKKFLKLNPKSHEKDLGWRADGRLEWYCQCGVGHTVYSPIRNYVHGCCGCCKGNKVVL